MSVRKTEMDSSAPNASLRRSTRLATSPSKRQSLSNDQASTSTLLCSPESSRSSPSVAPCTCSPPRRSASLPLAASRRRRSPPNSVDSNGRSIQSFAERRNRPTKTLLLSTEFDRSSPAKSQSSQSKLPSLINAIRSASPTTSAAAPSASTSSLPALLSHLSLAPAFPPTTTATNATATFSFNEHAFAHSTSPKVTATRRLLPMHPTYQPFIRSEEEMDLTDKRTSVGPHPHLFQRTKKRKLSHRFFRSEQILLGPKPATLSRSPEAEFSPGFEEIEGKDFRSLKRKYSPDLPRRIPTWWASVSRSSGDGLVSRMSPNEAEWVGEGEGWLHRVTVRPSHRARRRTTTPPTKLANQFDEAEEDEETVEMISPGGTLHTLTLNAPQPPRLDAMNRLGRNRANSSPPAFAPGMGSRISVLPPSTSMPWAPPPLKQHLLAVLRARMSENGGTSKASEAGLKFKKWVVWNSWMKKSKIAASKSDDEEIEIEPSSENEPQQRDYPKITPFAITDEPESIQTNEENSSGMSAGENETETYASSSSNDTLDSYTTIATSPPSSTTGTSLLSIQLDDSPSYLDDEACLTPRGFHSSPKFPAHEKSSYTVGVAQREPRSAAAKANAGRPLLKRSQSLPTLLSQQGDLFQTEKPIPSGLAIPMEF